MRRSSVVSGGRIRTVALAAVLAAASLAAAETPKKTSDAGFLHGAVPERYAKHASIGETVEIGGMSITVVRFGATEPTNEAIPRRGEQFVTVVLSYRNVGRNETQVFSRAVLRSEQGRKYGLMMLDGSIVEPLTKLPQSHLRPGQSTEGRITFAVPAEGGRFYWDEEFPNFERRDPRQPFSGRVVVELGSISPRTPTPERLVDRGGAAELGSLRLKILSAELRPMLLDVAMTGPRSAQGDALLRALMGAPPSKKAAAPPAEKMGILAMRVELSNVGTETQKSESLNMITVEDATGKTFSAAMLLRRDKSEPRLDVSSVPPRMRGVGWVYFVVPEDPASELRARLNPTYGRGTSAVVIGPVAHGQWPAAPAPGGRKR